MKRKIIEIDHEKCTGCGLCIPNCPEGALQIIDGKARLISDLFCDGLGACIGSCPEGAIEVVEREAEPYNEKKVMENIVKQGENVIKAHLKHLQEHGEMDLLKQAVSVLQKKNIPLDVAEIMHLHGAHHPAGCPGAKMMDFSTRQEEKADEETGTRSSQLRQWPVQLHLVPPTAPYYQNKDVLLVADCVAYALGDFHKDYLKGKSIAIACPKLDQGLDVYVQKITAMIDEAKINTLTVMTMEVPCCRGLLQVAQEAVQKAARKIPVKSIVVGIKGKILAEEWVTG